MTGNIKKNNKTGKWEFSFDAGINPLTGKRKQIRRRGFDSKSEATDAFAQSKTEVLESSFIDNSSMTYETFMNEYFKERKIAIQNSTYEIHTMYYRTIIRPTFGKSKLQKISHFLIQNFINILVQQSRYSPHTIHLIFRIIYSSFKKAKIIKLIKDNPCENITLPRKTRREMTIWSLDQVKYFLAEAPKIKRVTRCLIGFQIGLLTGMRQGEILGVRWKDIDFNKRLIYIRQTLTQAAEIKPGAKNFESVRTISISEALLHDLEIHQKELAYEKHFCRTTYYDNDLVLCTRDGSPIIPRNFRKEFYNLTEQLGLPQIRFHDTRHTHATLLIEQNINVKLIADRLGHADIQTTLNTYSHVLPNMQKSVSDKIDELLREEV